ncbi:PLP-dependent aminotransferase family protein [Dyella silvatica]|uniref:MocR-like pyridoxine biosynthesis transcription factor PdxR n=1 Tax=Dyella silvatica TaxID=2992128 RepID=UPI002257365A|nr:PLP-dependent aminotransferase family protein [Dyella silvatica]
MKPIAASFLPPVALDAKSSTPMYQQLSDWFRRAIIDGQLRPGQRVPSTRSLAHELKISRIPVLSAYEQLYAEGYLETFTGAGTCVASSIPGGASKPSGAKAWSAPPKVAGHSAPRRISQRAALMHGPPQTWLSNLGAFRVGLPALDHFPLATWSKLVNRHARHAPIEVMAYGDPMGYLPLREAIAEYLSTVRAVRCEASQIVMTTGSQQGLQICAHVLLDAKDLVWMEEPGYPGAHQAFKTAGAQLIPVPVDHEGLDVAEGIRRGRGARAAYISPSHQFPLGTTMSATRRLQLLSWAAANDAWIIEDDYDSEYRFSGRPIASLQGLDTEDRVIYLGTFSKVMFPAMRLGYMVVPKDMVAAFYAGRDAADTFSSTLYQVVMTDFIREGHFARHIRKMRGLYMERRTTLLEAIQKYVPHELEVIGAEAGMQLVALLPPDVSDVAVSKKAAQKGVSVRPLSLCYLNPPERGGLILGYGGAQLQDIRDGIRKLKSCW